GRAHRPEIPRQRYHSWKEEAPKGADGLYEGSDHNPSGPGVPPPSPTALLEDAGSLSTAQSVPRHSYARRVSDAEPRTHHLRSVSRSGRNVQNLFSVGKQRDPAHPLPVVPTARRTQTMVGAVEHSTCTHGPSLLVASTVLRRSPW